MCEILQLPTLPLQHILALLDASSLAALCCTCAELRKSCSGSHHWKSLCMQRWKRRDTEIWIRESGMDRYKELYRGKSRVDNIARDYLESGLYCQLNAEPSEPKYKTTYNLYKLGEEAREGIIQYIMAEQLQRRGRLEEIYKQVRCIQIAECMTELCQRAETEDIPVEDGALQIAQLFYPIADFSGIDLYLDLLAKEFKQRMKDNDVTRGYPALQILSRMLFVGLDASNSSEQWQSTEEQNRMEKWYPHEEEMDSLVWGPLHQAELKIPTGSQGLDLKGNIPDYSHPLNSLLPLVLLTGRGNPLSLCVVHAAVGRRAGLDIRGMDATPHYVNMLLDDNNIYFIDCFRGGRIETAPADLPVSVMRRYAENQARSITQRTWLRILRNLRASFHDLPRSLGSKVVNFVYNYLSGSPDTRTAEEVKQDKLTCFWPLANLEHH